jgi:carbonic anhydrase/acetyltransferase-like protein (isoleucine patch superfamily)
MAQNIFKARGFLPQIHPQTFLAPTAALIGDVQISEGASVWYGCTLRGDVMPIRVGKDSNVQDNTVIHGTYQKFATTIGERVTIGHSCILHGTTIEDECLIGMGSILMDGSLIGSGSIVGAGSLVTEGSKFPGGMLILGRPAKAIRPLKAEESAFLKQSAENYKFYQTWYENQEST